MLDYKILIEKDKTGKGRYQLQLYIDNYTLTKPFTAGIDAITKTGVCEIAPNASN